MLSATDRPLVSVSILTYNHEKFIAKAIESVLAQEVDFEYEIVIADDCSTDKTREILLEYAEQYPDLIKLILQETNQGINGNSNSLRRACRGIYRSHLEGDDSWSDRSKLRHQVEFLRNNEEYIAIGGAFECYDENGRKTDFPAGKISWTYALQEEYTMEHVKKWLLPAYSSSLTYRNIFYGMDEETLLSYETAPIIGDRKLAVFLACRGLIRYDKKVVVYRRVLRKSKTSYTSGFGQVSNASDVAYKWLCAAETMANANGENILDLEERKEISWKNALKAYGKTPSKTNRMIVKGIFKLSKHKGRYIKIAWQLVIERIKEVKKKEGKKKLIKHIFCYPFRVLKRAKEANRQEKKANSQEVTRKFLSNNM